MPIKLAHFRRYSELCVRELMITTEPAHGFLVFSASIERLSSAYWFCLLAISSLLGMKQYVPMLLWQRSNCWGVLRFQGLRGHTQLSPLGLPKRAKLKS